jgi:redox-sensitive bicupin YhaK (pirin superfamily)
VKLVLDGAVHVGDDKAEAFNKHHLVVLSAVEAQDGVTVRAAEEAARGVLIAGAPLDQDIVQVSLSIPAMISC